jgi:hypothetical protein
VRERLIALGPFGENSRGGVERKRAVDEECVWWLGGAQQHLQEAQVARCQREFKFITI